MAVTRICFPFTMELLGGRHGAADLAEQPQQNRLQIIHRELVRWLDLIHVVGEDYEAAWQFQIDTSLPDCYGVRRQSNGSLTYPFSLRDRIQSTNSRTNSGGKLFLWFRPTQRVKCRWP